MQDAYAKALCQNCPHGKVAFYTSSCVTKGQIISKRFFGVVDFLQKTNDNRSHSGKTNSFVRFLEEIDHSKKTFSKLTDL